MTSLEPGDVRETTYIGDTPLDPIRSFVLGLLQWNYEVYGIE